MTIRNESRPVAVFGSHWGATLAFVGSLGRRQVPIHVYGAGAVRWSRYCVRRARCPDANDADRFLPWLEARVRSGEIARLAPTTDVIAYYLACVREHFPPEVQRAITPLAEIETLLIKSRFAVACGGIGQPAPRSTAPRSVDEAVDAAERLGFPVILKPNSHLVVGFTERGHLLHDADDVRRNFRRYTVADGHDALASRYPELIWPLLQRFVPSARGGVLSVSGFKDVDGGLVAAMLSCKVEQWPPDTGVSTAQVNCFDPLVLRAGMDAVDRLVSRGIFELELLQDGEELVAIDLNPRAFGFMNLNIALGHDLPWSWFQSTIGPVPPMRSERLEDGPRIHCVSTVPSLAGRCVGALFGVNGNPHYRPQAAAIETVPMIGVRHDPIPLVIANFVQLRHAGRLLRPYLKAARLARQMAA